MNSIAYQTSYSKPYINVYMNQNIEYIIQILNKFFLFGKLSMILKLLHFNLIYKFQFDQTLSLIMQISFISTGHK